MLRNEQARIPLPLVALLAGLVALFGAGLNLGELVVDRVTPVPPGHGGRGSGSDNDHAKGPSGLAVASQGYVLRPRFSRFTVGKLTNFRFNIFTSSGQPVTEFTQRGAPRMTLVVVRRDMTGYQHLYPIMEPDGTWTVPVQFDKAGSYRAFAEFLTGTVTTPVTLGVDLEVPGLLEPGPITKVSTSAEVDGYKVFWTGDLIAGSVSRVWMHVMRDNVPVTDLDSHLGAAGHLVILREGDLANLHVNPVAGPRQDTSIAFDADVPSAGYYRMFMEFQHHGQVRTAEFTALAR
ncbi:MAG: hypothetical protein M3460_16415 [Actinomycetota bacterium]|nr:hypothetical protein [Actinomycetota bacterium]